MFPDRVEHRGAAYAIKGIFKVQEEDPLVLDVDAVVVEDGVSGVNGGFSTTPDAHTDLDRGKVVLGVGGGLASDALSGPAPHSVTDGNGTMAAGLLQGSKQVAAAKVGSDGVRDLPSSDEIDDARHGRQKRVSAIGGDALPKVRSSAGGWAAGGEGVKGREGGEDF